MTRNFCYICYNQTVQPEQSQQLNQRIYPLNQFKLIQNSCRSVDRGLFSQVARIFSFNFLQDSMKMEIKKETFTLRSPVSRGVIKAKYSKLRNSFFLFRLRSKKLHCSICPKNSHRKFHVLESAPRSPRCSFDLALWV